MDSAPSEKPAKASRTIVMSSLEVQLPPMNQVNRRMNKILNPNTAKPATPSPITVPPVNDTFNACGKLVLAAWVVLTLAAVAILIPMFPATAEKTAPITKATTMNQCVVSTKVEITPSRIPANTTKMANTRYSALRNANAPSRM